MTDRHREAYREEAIEILGELETSLLELEKEPQDKDLVGRVFRAMHTIKGSGAMFGFDEIAAFTHSVESAYDLVRSGGMDVTKALIDLTLEACDQIRAMVEPGRTGGQTGTDEAARISSAFLAMLGDVQSPAVKAPAPPAHQPESVSPDSKTYRIHFRPAPDLFMSGTNPVPLLNELRELGSCRVIAHTDAIPLLADMDPEACYTYWDIILSTTRGVDAIRDVFIFVEGQCELQISVADDSGDESDYKKLGQILIDRGDLKPEQVEAALASQRRLGELLVDAGLVEERNVEAALIEQQQVREVKQARSDRDQATSIRVPSEKLDHLVNMVGELVTLQSRLIQTAERIADRELTLVAEEVERLITELRDNTMSIRMLPIGTIFSNFKRLVRDLSGELGKEVVLTTEGAETELDKTVLDRLNNPLVHLIRNAVDHGIETPDAREQAGKSRTGTIRLSAEHSGANVLIRVEDDGAGLDRDAIFNKAVQMKLVASNAVLADKDVFSFILAPGFSTAQTVTNVSGRGVGMDAVNRSLDALHGTLEISSHKGRGTMLTLKLPLTLAIIDGLQVLVGDEHYILPLSAIEEVAELVREAAGRSHGRNLAEIRGSVVPYIRLRELFGIVGQSPAIEQIITTLVEGYRIGIVVDQVIGEHQTVIKSLGRTYHNIDVISGATILGNGSVALILDIPKLVHKAEAAADVDSGRRH